MPLDQFLSIKFSEVTEQLLLTGDWTAGNCSHDLVTFDQPPASVFLKNLSGSQVALLTVGSALTIVVLLLACAHWFYVWTYVGSERRQNKLYFLITLFPVASICCLIGMYAPRTSLVVTSCGVLYFMMCLFVLVSLIRNLFGGRASFSNTLEFDDREINFQSPPFCCCCFFLPHAPSSEKNLRRIEWIVLQAPVIRAAVVASNIIAIAEFRESAQTWLHYSEMVAVVSLLLAIFGTHTLARLTTTKLSEYSFMTIFRLVDVALLFFTAQQPMLFEHILVYFGVFKCGPMMTAVDNARFVCNFVIICEMALLSLLASILLAPRRNALFDKYSHKNSGRISKLQLNLTEETMLTPEC